MTGVRLLSINDMYTVKRSALVSFSAQQMYDLVNDVDDYQSFLPWCGDSKIVEKSDEQITASVTIAFSGINKTFTTHNTLRPHEEIAMRLVNGPFSELFGSWHFKALPEGTSKISLDLKFGFNNRLVGAVVGPVFSKIADSMVESFCNRAQVIYEGHDG